MSSELENTSDSRFQQSAPIIKRKKINQNIPLCIALEDTLIKTDLFWESFWCLLRQHPIDLIFLPFWLLKGKFFFNEQLAKRARLELNNLPYNAQLLEFLKKKHKKQCPLWLITSDNQYLARQIANFLKIFTGVISNNEIPNLKGNQKLEQIKEFFGEQPFAYAGNSKMDHVIWDNAKEVILVNAPKKSVKYFQQNSAKPLVFNDEKSFFPIFIKSIRLHQWLKNTLIFVPLLTAHELFNPDKLLLAFYAWLGFGLCSSSAYLLNDLFDLESDRNHPIKKERPLASGDMSLLMAMLLYPLFLSGGMVIGYWINVNFLLILVQYWLLTTIYSFLFKQIAVLDVIILGVLYTFRIFAGLEATESDHSNWLIAFSIFFFISLALVKRCSEIYNLPPVEGNSQIKGRGYIKDDWMTLMPMGIGIGCVSIIIMALYINSEHVRSIYRNPAWLWSICVFLLYWINRLWLLCSRGQIHEDPIVFILKDKVSYFVISACLLIVLVSGN